MLIYHLINLTLRNINIVNKTVLKQPSTQAKYIYKHLNVSTYLYSVQFPALFLATSAGLRVCMFQAEGGACIWEGSRKPLRDARECASCIFDTSFATSRSNRGIKGALETRTCLEAVSLLPSCSDAGLELFIDYDRGCLYFVYSHDK